MKVLKTLFFILLCLSITNCKVTFTEDDDVLTVSEETDEDKKETNLYLGDVDNVRYFVGGWYGPQPNYKIDLTMSVIKSGEVKAELDIPECKMTGKVDAKDYAKVISIVENDELIPKLDGIRIDGGYNQIELTRGDKKETVYVRRSDGQSSPLMSDKGAETLEAKLDEIVSGLLENADCHNGGDSDILAFYYHETKNTHLYSRPQQNQDGSSLPRPVAPKTEREFKIVNTDGVLRVHGSERQSFQTGRICFKHLDGKRIDSSLLADMEAVKFVEQMYRCEYMPIDVVTIGKTTLDGKSIEGSPGCHASVRVSNHEAFREKFLAWLSKQPSNCNVVVH